MGRERDATLADVDDPWKRQLASLGQFIRQQRRMANLSLRQLADIAKISNPYLSQIERGLHEPSVRVIKALAEALDLSAETLLEQAGVLEDVAARDGGAGARKATERAIRTDPLLTPDQKDALITVYRSYVAAATSPTERTNS